MSARDAQSEQRVRGIRYNAYEICTHPSHSKIAVDRVPLASDSRLRKERGREEDAMHQKRAPLLHPAQCVLSFEVVREEEKRRDPRRVLVSRVNSPRRRPAEYRTTTSSRRRRARASNHTERAYRRDLTRTTEHG